MQLQKPAQKSAPQEKQQEAVDDQIKQANIAPLEFDKDLLPESLHDLAPKVKDDEEVKGDKDMAQDVQARPIVHQPIQIDSDFSKVQQFPDLPKEIQQKNVSAAAQQVDEGLMKVVGDDQMAFDQQFGVRFDDNDMPQYPMLQSVANSEL